MTATVSEKAVRAPFVDAYTQTDELPPPYQKQFRAAQKAANFVAITNNIIKLKGIERVGKGWVEGDRHGTNPRHIIQVFYCNGNSQSFGYSYTMESRMHEESESAARELRDRDLQIIARALIPQNE